MGFQGLRATGTGAKGSRSRGVAHEAAGQTGRPCSVDGVDGGRWRTAELAEVVAEGGAPGLLIHEGGPHGPCEGLQGVRRAWASPAVSNRRRS